jgi:hypothetical protein
VLNPLQSEAVAARYVTGQSRRVSGKQGVAAEPRVRSPSIRLEIFHHFGRRHPRVTTALTTALTTLHRRLPSTTKTPVCPAAPVPALYLPLPLPRSPTLSHAPLGPSVEAE